jgi:hypothetical protein
LKKIYKFILGLGIVSIVLFGLYAYKLHSLAIAGNNLFGERCANVNPYLISYKNSFLKFSDSVINSDNYKEGDMFKFLTDYEQSMRKYVAAETDWLTRNIEFIERGDTRIIMPWYMMDGARLQQEMYKAYRDDAKTMLEIYDNGGGNEQLINNQKEARDRRDKAREDYADFNDKALNYLDWRWRFLQLPAPPECTPENTYIPDTTGALDIPVAVPEEKSDITG